MPQPAMPGPWMRRRDVRLYDESNYAGFDAAEIYSPGYGVVAYVPLRLHDDGESDANARLVEAAAHLLAACKEVLGHLPDAALDGSWDHASAALLRSAIEKARGGR
jgi:hypothetical protein